MNHLTTALTTVRTHLEAFDADDAGHGRMSIVGIIVAILAVIGLFAIL